MHDMAVVIVRLRPPITGGRSRRIFGCVGLSEGRTTYAWRELDNLIWHVPVASQLAKTLSEHASIMQETMMNNSRDINCLCGIQRHLLGPKFDRQKT
jgi:hypothetical protein